MEASISLELVHLSTSKGKRTVCCTEFRLLVPKRGLGELDLRQTIHERAFIWPVPMSCGLCSAFGTSDGDRHGGETVGIVIRRLAG